MPGPNREEKCDPVLILAPLWIDRSWYKYGEQDKIHFPFCSSWTDKKALLTSASCCLPVGSLKYCE